MTGRERHRPPVRELTPASADVVDDGSGEHDHPLPRPIVWAAAALVVGVLTGLLLLAAYAYSITSRLSQVEAYIADRGQLRDEQAAALQAQLDDAICDVLDQLPAGDTALNPLRAQYDCGPGTRPEEIP